MLAVQISRAGVTSLIPRLLRSLLSGRQVSERIAPRLRHMLLLDLVLKWQCIRRELVKQGWNRTLGLLIMPVSPDRTRPYDRPRIL